MISLMCLLMGPLVGAEPLRWPAFLGAGATAIDVQTIPLRWSPNENVAWKTSLPGKGQSSPVIWGGRVFVTAIDGPMKDTCQVLALDLADGRIAWRQEFPASQKVRSNYFQSRAAPTPVVDAEGVYAFFETGDVGAWSHEGKPLWRRSLTKDYGAFESRIGLAASPVQTEDSIILLIDHEGPSYVLALDKRTGTTRWKTERDSRVSYASPSLIPVGPSWHLVCSSAGSIDGYDPKTGKLLWSVDDVGGNTATTPLALGNGRLLIGAGPGMHNEREPEARRTNFVLAVEPEEGSYRTKVLWRTTEAMTAFASPIVYRNCAYWVNRLGIVYCYDAETGKLHYSQRLRQLCWATPVGIGDRVYFFGKDGLTTVLAAGPEFRVLAENALWEQKDPPAAPQGVAGSAPGEHGQPSGHSAPPTPARGGRSGNRPEAGPGGLNFADPVQYGVAIVNGSIVIRTGGVVYCVREPR
ncbi:MAG: PQQ-binding-like beta-propeller repeat protein [Gemmataceae bacterium]|nr:PQQ-binding-like beta-propeller repeat protein [Gemmataceae bacterium]MDW8263941.1 PQQ-binding-like beta-propeller repeat protein [Gemmataceae bacterium]